jgi:hypothetical protein
MTPTISPLPRFFTSAFQGQRSRISSSAIAAFSAVTPISIVTA